MKKCPAVSIQTAGRYYILIEKYSPKRVYYSMDVLIGYTVPNTKGVEIEG